MSNSSDFLGALTSRPRSAEILCLVSVQRAAGRLWSRAEWMLGVTQSHGVTFLLTTRVRPPLLHTKHTQQWGLLPSGVSPIHHNPVSHDWWKGGRKTHTMGQWSKQVKQNYLTKVIQTVFHSMFTDGTKSCKHRFYNTTLYMSMTLLQIFLGVNIFFLLCTFQITLFCHKSLR